jgi:hypothetical protein
MTIAESIGTTVSPIRCSILSAPARTFTAPVTGIGIHAAMRVAFAANRFY